MDWFTSLPGVDELESAEDFLDFFNVSYDPEQVRINRLHIMHQFNQKLRRSDAQQCHCESDRHLLARTLLEESYRNFHHQEAKTHSTLQVYQRLAPSFVPFSALTEVSL